jgi:flagella basal body P-ring formation protein FlgA
MIRVAWGLLLLALSFFAPAMAQQASAPLFSVTLDEAQSSVEAALMAEGAAESLKAEIISTRQPLLYQYKQPLEVQVRTLKFSEADHTWSANLLFASNGEVVSAMPASGRYEETRRVPVLTQRLSHGEEITAQHIAMKDFTLSRLRQDVVMDEKELIGKTPRRTISVSRPIRAEEVQAPDVLKKGSMVRMIYETPYMEISASGEALENGTLGQSVRIRNRDSNVAVYGTVISADEVRVTKTVRDRKLARR